MNQALYVILGFVAGALSGMLGIGGGIILIPALIFLFGFTQLQAQGTTLALMIPPIGLLAALRYYQAGNVKLSIAGFICLGFFVGGFIGANLVQNLPEALLRKIFAVFLFFISLRMFFAKY
ncbi:MAG: sulfite exporter TauE/SafE family protein [Candidatus Omnitrophica bacterium]|nr:sulfite exporter TauE/SafE family protein [Candidatus Omnitrophota bacterium]